MHSTQILCMPYTRGGFERVPGDVLRIPREFRVASGRIAPHRVVLQQLSHILVSSSTQEIHLLTPLN